MITKQWNLVQLSLYSRRALFQLLCDYEVRMNMSVFWFWAKVHLRVVYRLLNTFIESFIGSDQVRVNLICIEMYCLLTVN